MKSTPFPTQSHADACSPARGPVNLNPPQKSAILLNVLMQNPEKEGQEVPTQNESSEKEENSNKKKAGFHVDTSRLKAVPENKHACSPPKGPVNVNPPKKSAILLDVLMQNPEKEGQEVLPQNVSSEKEANSNKKKAGFHVDTSRLEAVPENKQASELSGLGLTVYNQDDFEQGVVAQMEEALDAEEMERKKKMWMKEMTSLTADMRSCKEELCKTEKIIQMMKSGAETNKVIKQKLQSVKSQKETKQKQLKSLKAKMKSLSKKLDCNVDDSEEDECESAEMNALESTLGLDKKVSETEIEKMIRLGEMTPFGTQVVLKDEPERPKAPKLMLSETSPFDQYLLDQEKKHMMKRKVPSKKPSATATAESSKVEHVKDKATCTVVRSDSKSQLKKQTKQDRESKESKDTNFFDSKDKRIYRPAEKDFSNYRQSQARGFHKLEHNFTGDGALSDQECGDEDEAYEETKDKDHDYQPERDDVLDSEDDYTEQESPKKKRKVPKRKKEGDWFKYDKDDSVPLKKKKSSTKSAAKSRSRDDGDEEMYRERISLYRKENAKKKYEKLENGEPDSDDESDVEFEGGFKVPGKIWNKLYKYQRTGVKWLWELHSQQAGGIVGDEMGLGKTIQITAFLAGLRHSNMIDKGAVHRYRGLGPTLIVVPTTVMHQWVTEIHKWAPMFRVAVLHNTGTYSSSEESLVRNLVKHCGILVTAYSSVLIYQEVLLEYNWHYVILDEGHKIRNPDAQITIACKKFRTCHRLILSGSPIQNNLKELWSLFDFVFPGKLGTLPDFMAHFSVPIVQGGYANATDVQVQTAYKCACVLRDTISPYLLRRMKADVKESIQLPEKNEQVLFCRLTDLQRDVYNEYLESRECREILHGNFMIFPGLITLRKICNHPDLSTGGPCHFDPDFNEMEEEEKAFGFWKRSGKLMVVESLLKLWHKQEHRVLLFTQGTQMLNILEKFVQQVGYSYMRMDGTTSIGARQNLIEKFNTNPSVFLFLLTTRVGGLGVNLCGANRIIIFDPDWNPSTDTQARERAWRIGQKKQVTIYRLLTTGTLEEKIYHRQIFKQFLTNRVLKDPKQRRFFKSNDLFELFSLSSDDPQHGTETGAIFAGTGSEVTVKVKDRSRSSKSAKPNRFDEMKARGDETNFDDDCDEDESKKKSLEEEERKERMREFARKLSQQLEKEKQELEKQAEKEIGTNSEQPCTSKEAVDEPTVNAGDEALHSCGEKSSNDTQDNESSQNDVEDSKCKVKSEIDPELMDGSNDCPSTSTAKKRKSKKQKKDKKRDGTPSSSSSSERKKKKKRRQKDAVVEGEKIAYLARHSVFKRNEEDEKREQQSGDDFVLQKLFKKSGVHSALQHDTIMMSSNPDYALVEGEANRVAKEAAAALKKSRHRCHSANTGIPTWTGQNGASRSSTPTGMPKPRFGQKKNATIVASPPKEEVKNKAAETTSTSRDEHLDIFQGRVAGNVRIAETTSSTNVMNSSELLSRMRHRNNYASTSANQDDEEDTVNGRIVEPDQESLEFITDIRNYIAFCGQINGQATTQELLDEFSAKIPSSDSAKFKAMLKQICSFRKHDGIGIWRLKPEYR